MKIGSGLPHILRRIILLIGLGAGFLLTAGCGGGGGGQGGTGPILSTCPNQTTNASVSGPNTLPVWLGVTGNNSSSVCGAYINVPCTDVTICTSSGSDCQTVTNMLVDTGSSGVRVFKTVLSQALYSSISSSPITVGGQPVGECARFGNGSYGDWGPLVFAQVTLGGEPPVTPLPIQIIDPTYAGQYTSSGSPNTPNPSCGSSFVPDTSPSQAGFNGILGVGLGVHWCGSTCTTSASSGYYYTCSSTTCSSTTLSESDQDQNPVASLPNGDHNGVVLSLSCPAAAGSAQLTGTLIIGIGTESNNTPGTGVTAYPTTGSPDFVFDTTFQGTTYTLATYPNLAYLDSGSPAYFFTDTGIPFCSSPNSSTYCPASPLFLTAQVAGDGGSPSATIDFSVAAPSFSESVYGNIGIQGNGFDWGLPFFFGREVYVGINGKSSLLGNGPYWAF